jgi:hypothetical protein
MSKCACAPAPHREELAPFAADEHAVDPEIVNPVPQVLAQARLVDGEIGKEGRCAAAQRPLKLAGVALASRRVNPFSTFLFDQARSYPRSCARTFGGGPATIGRPPRRRRAAEAELRALMPSRRRA